MLKAERMKKKMGLGKSAKVVIETVTVKERVNRDSDGMFVGLGFDSVDPVETLGEKEEVFIIFRVVSLQVYELQAASPRPGSRLSNAPTEVTDTEPSDLPGLVDDLKVKTAETIEEQPDENAEASTSENPEEAVKNDEMDENPPEETEELESTNDDMEETAEMDDEMDQS